MYSFHFVYSDGRVYEASGITRVIVSTPAGTSEFAGDNILSARIPLRTMWLYSQNGVITVSGENLTVIDVLREE